MLLTERHRTIFYRDTKTSHLRLRWMKLCVWIKTLACLPACCCCSCCHCCWCCCCTLARFESLQHQPLSMYACVIVLVFLEFVEYVRVCARLLEELSEILMRCCLPLTSKMKCIRDEKNDMKNRAHFICINAHFFVIALCILCSVRKLCIHDSVEVEVKQPSFAAGSQNIDTKPPMEHIYANRSILTAQSHRHIRSSIFCLSLTFAFGLSKEKFSYFGSRSRSIAMVPAFKHNYIFTFRCSLCCACLVFSCCLLACLLVCLFVPILISLVGVYWVVVVCHALQRK